MFPSIAKRLLLGVAFFSLSAWSQQPEIRHYPVTTKSTTSIATVAVVWLPSFKVANEICAFMAGVDPATTEIYACYNRDSNIIYTVEPADFNDHFLLEVLGHEFWHALGATHPGE